MYVRYYTGCGRSNFKVIGILFLKYEVMLFFSMLVINLNFYFFVIYNIAEFKLSVLCTKSNVMELDNVIFEFSVV